MQLDNDESDTADITPIIDPLATAEPVDVDVNVPAVYEERLSWKSWVKRAMPYLGLLWFIVILLTLTNFGGFLNGWIVLLMDTVLILCGALAVFMSYREYWRWRAERYYANPEEGVLFQYQARNKWLFLLGSDARQLNLDTAEYQPRPKTLWEHYVPLGGFRHSCTVSFEGPTQGDAEFFSNIRDFMHAERVAAIILYRKFREQQHQEKDLSLQERQALASEMTVTLLGTAIEMLGELLEIARSRR